MDAEQKDLNTVDEFTKDGEQRENDAPKNPSPQRRNLWWLLHNYLGLLTTAAIVVSLDQGSKELVRDFLPFGERWTPLEALAPYMRIVNWGNTGAAFGIFQGFGDIFMVLAIVVVIVIAIYYPRVPGEEWPLRLAMGMQLGGALGNLIDRFALGYVTDFISIGPFPVFNVADASITSGAAILLLGVWWSERQERARRKLTSTEERTGGGDTESVISKEVSSSD